MKSTRAKLLFILFIFVFLVSSVGLISCDKVYDIEEVKLTSTPSFVETGIELGDTLDFTGVGLEVTYSNGVVEYVDVTEAATISGFRKDVVGEQIVTIIYTNGTVEKEVSLSVTVKRPAVKSVEVLSTQKNTSYVKGNAFNFEGLSAVVTYDKLDASGKPYTETFALTRDNVANQTGRDYFYSPDVVGEQHVRFLLYADTYATLKVTVTDHLVTGVAMFAPPTKTAYAEGAALDLTGAQVRLYMNDAVTERTYTVVSDGNGGWTLKDFHGTIEAKGIAGETFDASTIGTYNLYFYYQEAEDCPVYKTGTTVSLEVVDRDLKSGGVSFSSNLPRQIQNNQAGLNFAGITMTATFNDQTTATYDMAVTYDAVRDVYVGEGFYISGYDITRPIAQNAVIHFYKTVHLEDGSTVYTTEEYPTFHTVEIITLEEGVSAIVIADNSVQGVEYTRYVDLTNPTQYVFDGYVGDAIPVDQYAFTLVYNSGKEEDATLSDFVVDAPPAYFAKVDGSYVLLSEGSTALSFNYGNGIKTRVITVNVKTPEFDATNDARFVLTNPTKLEYEQGTDEQLDLTGAVAEIYLQDVDTKAPVQKIVLQGTDLLPYVTSQFSLDVAGEQTVTIEYQGAVRSFDIFVKSQVKALSIVSDDRSNTSFVKGTALDRTADFSGLSIAVEYVDQDTPSVVVTDFSDASWVFEIAGTPIDTYPLESGYTATYQVSIFYMGVLCDTTVAITVHNYVQAITFADSNLSYEVIEGVAIDESAYTLVVTYEDGTTADLLMADAIFSHDYDYGTATAGEKTVTVSVATAVTGGADVTTSATWQIAPKVAENYELTLSTGTDIPTVTVNTPLDEAQFVLLQHYNNGTSSTTTFEFSAYDASDVTAGSVKYVEVYVLVGGEKVDFTFASTDTDKIDVVDGGEGFVALKVKVVYDFVNKVEFVDGNAGKSVSLKQGYYFNNSTTNTLLTSAEVSDATYWGAALDTIRSWTLRVTYVSGAVVETSVSSGAFRVDGYDQNTVGGQAVTLVSTSDENVQISFNVNVIKKVLQSVTPQGTLNAITEGTDLTNDVFTNAYLLATYDNGSTENVSIFVTSSSMTVSGYDKVSDRVNSGDSITVTINVEYQGYDNEFSLTVNKRVLVGIKIDDQNAPKNEYYELEDFAIVNEGGVEYLATADGTAAKFYLQYNNGELVLLEGDASKISRAMLLTDIGQFNSTDLTTDAVVPVTVGYVVDGDTYNATFNIWLHDRLSPRVDKESYDANQFVYYYGVQPTINYTLKYYLSSSDLTGVAVARDDVGTPRLRFISQSNVVYIPQYDSGTLTITGYVIEDTASILTYLPVGSYTVSILYDGREHVSADLPGLNQYENNDKVLTIVKTPLKTGFAENANLTYTDGKYTFSDVYGTTSKSGIYVDTYFAGFVTYSYSHDGGETYLPNFVEGDVKDDVITKITIKDSRGNVITTPIIDAGSYVVVVELLDKAGSSILSNYQVTTANMAVEIARRQVYVEFFNSLVAEDISNIVATVYGGEKVELGNAYYRVWAVDDQGNRTDEEGLIAGDVLEGALGKNSIGTDSLGGVLERRDYEVGYYSIQLGSLNNPNYQLLINSLDGVYFDDVYYVIEPAPITVTLDNETSTYGSDGIVVKNSDQVGTISTKDQLFSINGKVYSYKDSTVYEDVSVGTVDTANSAFTIKGVAYTYVNSSVLKNGATQVGSYIYTSSQTIRIDNTYYFYMEKEGVNHIYENRGVISLDTHTMTVDRVSYNFSLKEEVAWSMTISSSDGVYNATYRVDLVDGKYVDSVTGLDISFSVLFDGGDRPSSVGTYVISGDVDSADISSYNYYVSAINDGAYTITKKTVTIIPVANTKVYDGQVATTPAFSYDVKFAEVLDLKLGTITGNVSRDKQGSAEGENVGSYLYNIGDIANPNYDFVVAEVYYTIVERQLYMAFEEDAITREYNGQDPSIDFRLGEFSLYYLDQDNNKVEWDKSLVVTSSLSMTFGQALPSCGKYAMTLTETDSNHNIVLDGEYKYTITEKLIDVIFSTRNNSLEDVPSNWTTLNSGDQLTYAYADSRIIKATPIGVVAGDTVTIGIDLESALNVANYVVNALTIDGNNNYAFRVQTPSVTFSIVRKNVYVYVPSASLTMQYNGNTANVRLSDVELYEQFESISVKYPLDSTEEGALSQALSFVIGDGNSISWTPNGYSVKVSLTGLFNQNYTVNTVSDKEYLATSFVDGEYVEGHGGYSNNALVYIINKQRTTVTIAAGNLTKYFDDTDPRVSMVSVEPFSISDKVKNALTYTRLTTPYGTPIADTDNYAQKDVGTFRIGINNSLLDGNAGNYYCTLERQDYVYTIYQRQVTVDMSQGTATNIYRRYNGMPLTNADVVTTEAIDGVTRTITMSNYRPASVTATADIIKATGLKFVFTNLMATEVGTYQFYPVSEDYNHYFTIKGEDEDGFSTFEIRRCTLDVTISNTMYRYYQQPTKYYDNGAEILLGDAFTINSQVYVKGTETKSVSASIVDGKITVDNKQYFVVGTSLFDTTPISGVYASINSTEVVVGKTDYPLSNINGTVFSQFGSQFYINNKDKTIHQYIGSIDDATAPTTATLDVYVLTALTKADFAGLSLNTTLSTNDSARIYTGKLHFSLEDTFEDTYANYSLPGLTSKILEIKPAVIDVTIDDTDANGDALEKQYGNYISDVEKYLLKEGKIDYTLPEGVIYSGSIDSTSRIIEIYSTKYYYMDGEIFLILGDLKGASLTVSGVGYVVDNDQLYRIHGNYADGAFTVGAKTYYINGSVVCQSRGTSSNGAYFYADEVGTYDNVTGLVKLNAIDTRYRIVGGDVITNDAVGTVVPQLSSLNIEGARYSYTADGYVYRTAGTIDTSVQVITIGNDEYIYVGTKVFNVVGHFDNNLFTIERQTYAIENGNLYLDGTLDDGTYDSANMYFSVGSARFVYDSQNNVYNVVGAFIDDDNDNIFDLNGTRYYYQAGDSSLYDVFNEYGYSSPRDTANYSIDQQSRVIVAAGVKYTYSTLGYIREVVGSMVASDVTIGDTTYRIDLDNAVWTPENTPVGRLDGTLLMIDDQVYNIDGSDVYQVVGSVNADGTITLDSASVADSYVIVGDTLKLEKGKYDSVNSKVTLGELSYKVSNRYVFYDTELSVGTYENMLFTLADLSYFVNGNVVFTDSNVFGSIALSDNEFTIGSTKYIFATTPDKTIAYNTEQVTFTYYKEELGTDGKLIYTQVNMSNMQDVGEYYFTVNFGGRIDNVVDGKTESGNFTLRPLEYGSITITQAPVYVTLSGNLDWVYRQAFVDSQDFSRDNMASIMTLDCTMDTVFDPSSILYPTLTDEAKARFNSLATTDEYGTVYTVDSSWFTSLDTTNKNYNFVITGSATITVVKRQLKTSVVSIDRTANAITKTVTTDYGVLPSEANLAVLYTGFSDTEFGTSYQGSRFETAVYHADSNTWYVVYDYNQNADSNTIVLATAEQVAVLDGVISTNASLPDFYKSIDGEWVDLYDAGVTNRIKVSSNSGFVSNNYAVLAVDNFTYVVNPIALTLTLQPKDNATVTKIYGEVVKNGVDYNIVFTDKDGRTVGLDDAILTIVIDGVTYKVDTPNSLFFNTQDPSYNWLVYDEKVNMNNDGTDKGSPVQLTLGDKANAELGTQATSKFEGVTPNYTLTYQYGNPIIIKIYNKIESIAVGDGALYSAVTGSDSFVPITVTYKDGTKLDTLKYYLNPTLAGGTSPGLTMGDDGDFIYVYDASIGNQIVKISYKEVNQGLPGGEDSASVYITLRSYDTTDTKTQNSISSDAYKKFAYTTYMTKAEVDGLDIKTADGVISLDSDGDGNADVFFLMVAVADGIFLLDGVEYSYSGGIVTRVSDATRVGTIDISDKSMQVEGTTYYIGCSVNNVRIYKNRDENGTLLSIVSGSQFSLKKYVYAVNTNISNTVYTIEVDGSLTDTQSFSVANTLGYDSIEFVPSSASNVEIRLIDNMTATATFVTMTDTLETFDKTTAGVVSIDVDGDGVGEYYAMLALVGRTTVKARMLYVYREGDPTDKFATFALEDEVTEWSTGSISTLSNLVLTIDGDVFKIKTSLVAIDKGYATVSADGYVLGTTRTVEDGYTHEYKVETEGEFDKLQIEFSLKPLYGKSGEFNFVIYSYQDATTNTLYELSLRLLTGAEHRGKLYVVESIDGRETVTAYNTYRSLTTGVAGTYYDLMDGKTHHVDVYLNRLSCVLTIVVDEALRTSHSLLSDSGITLEDGSIITGVSFPLEDYSSYYDGDNVFSTTKVISTAYFTVKDLTFSVSSMAFVNMGYYNEMAIVLMPSDTAETVLYVNQEDPLKAITIGDYFAILGNYHQGTVMKYYLNGVHIEAEARRIWLEEGVYCLTAQILYNGVVLSEADFYLTIAIEDQDETIADQAVSYTSPVVLEATTETVYQGNTTKHYNYYRAEFSLDGINGVTYDGTVYNMIINIKSNDGTTSAFSATSNAYTGLSLGVKFGDVTTTDLMLRVKGETYKESTTLINWLNGGSDNYVVEAYMDDYNHVVTVIVYRGTTRLHTFTVKKDTLYYSTTNIFIENESSDTKYSQKSRNIDTFIDSVGSQSLILTDAKVILSYLALNTDCDIRQSLYSITGSGSTSGTQTPILGDVYNSSINPTSMVVGSGQYSAIMLGRGDNVPYAMDYNTYTTEFSVKRAAGGAAQVRFIIAENMSDDISKMYNAYRENDNFTATRSIALVYEDDGYSASMYFTFMVNGLSNVYRKYVYENVYDRTDSRVLSYGENETETKHSVSVNIFKSPESITNDDLFTASNVTVMYIQVVIDGEVVTDGSGAKQNFYFPYYNSVAFWKDYPNSDATSADSVNLNDKYFLNQYTMAGVVFTNCTLSLYDMQVAKGESLTVSEQYVLDVVKGGDESATNFYYYKYFSDLYGLGGAYKKRTYVA